MGPRSELPGGVPTLHPLAPHSMNKKKSNSPPVNQKGPGPRIGEKSRSLRKANSFSPRSQAWAPRLAQVRRLGLFTQQRRYARRRMGREYVETACTRLGASICKTWAELAHTRSTICTVISMRRNATWLVATRCTSRAPRILARFPLHANVTRPPSIRAGSRPIVQGANERDLGWLGPIFQRVERNRNRWLRTIIYARAGEAVLEHGAKTKGTLRSAKLLLVFPPPACRIDSNVSIAAKVTRTSYKKDVAAGR